jgi:precorrin-2 dehydrogenase / sirohydrochlorin ferrochelatase
MEQWRYLPINLTIQGRPVLVAGGGPVATRKCQAAVAAGGIVTVAAPQLSLPLRDMVAAGAITHWPRTFVAGDTAGFYLIYAATDDSKVNWEIAAEATSRQLLVDVVDAPDAGTFVSPAVVARGNLLIAVSTGGASPAMARRIRDEIAEHYGSEYAQVLEILAAVRQKLLTESPKKAYNNRIFEHLASSDLPRLCREGDAAAIDRLLGEVAGSGYTLAELGLSAKDLS